MRSHLSGKPWRDIDIHLVDQENPSLVIARMVAFLRFVLGLHAHEVCGELTKPSRYGTFSAKLTVLRSHQRVDVNLDVSTNGPKFGITFLPATIGSCLYMKKGAIGFRMIDTEITTNWRVCEIVELLRHGIDVIFVMSSVTTKRYRRFFWMRIDACEAHQWKLRPSLRPLPQRVPDE